MYTTGTGWVPPKDLALCGAVDRRCSPTKAKKKSPSPTKKPSPVRKVERQIASGKGPVTIAGSNTYKLQGSLCGVQEVGPADRHHRAEGRHGHRPDRGAVEEDNHPEYVHYNKRS